MTLGAIAFACGAAALQWQAALPGWGGLAVLPPLMVLSFVKPKFLPAPALAAGLRWAAAFAHLRMNDWLAPQLEGRDVAVVGVVSSLPARMERGVRFEL